MKRWAAFMTVTALSVLMATNAWAASEQNQTSSAAAESTANPLDLSHLKKWIVIEPANNPAVFWGHVNTEPEIKWINDDQYLMNHPEITKTQGLNQFGYSVKKAIEMKNVQYMSRISLEAQYALAELAGFPRVGQKEFFASRGAARVDALKQSITAFLNSFPNWKTASDFEKAVRICEWIKENTTYERGNDAGDDDCGYPYGALVNGRANCSGLTSAVDVLAWAVDLPVFGISPKYAAHISPTFFINGIWLQCEITNKSTDFRVCNVYELNELDYLQVLGQYCEAVGYTIPTTEQVKAAFPGLWKPTSKGGVEIMFHYPKSV